MTAARGEDKPWGQPPSAADFERVGQAALAALPEPFRSTVRDVVIVIQDFAEDEILDEMGIESPFDLTGLYHGVPVGERESRPFGTQPDMIFLYRRPILDEWCEGGEDLEHLIRHVLIHEIGHHFGLSDEGMAAIEAAADEPD
ncbi:metallopeptidase family protein [Marinivivus vitaminiproducens]|uniref:metallopeptidase family protein n=1 Tax=Marinivivus vitaminiproducens TaxID=3035935 RepID=UPI0027A10C81|nr:metallopeptidase family protein [Geminicoccaceae bacterium SCSIO 64248]